MSKQKSWKKITTMHDGSTTQQRGLICGYREVKVLVLERELVFILWCKFVPLHSNDISCNIKKSLQRHLGLACMIIFWPTWKLEEILYNSSNPILESQQKREGWKSTVLGHFIISFGIDWPRLLNSVIWSAAPAEKIKPLLCKNEHLGVQWTGYPFSHCNRL